MTELRGYLLSEEIDTDIVSAYAAGLSNVPAVVSAPGWTVVGGFYLPKQTAARLDMICAVSDASLSMQGRLYLVDTFTPVSGSTTGATSSVSDTRVLSPVMQLAVGLYTIHAQVTGATGAGLFGLFRTAGLVS